MSNGDFFVWRRGPIRGSDAFSVSGAIVHSQRSAATRVISAYSIKNYFYFAGSIGLMLLLPLGVIFIVQTLRDAHSAGLYALSYAITAPIHALLAGGLRNYLAIDRPLGFKISELAAHRVWVALFILIATAAICAIRGSSGPEAGVLLAMATTRGVEAYVDLTAGQFQRANRGDFLLLSHAARTCVYLCVFVLLILLSLELWVSMLLGTIAMLVSTLVVDRRLLRTIAGAEDVRPSLSSIFSWKPLSISSATLSAGFLNSAHALETNLPRYVVEWVAGMSFLGVFTTLGFGLSAATNICVPIFMMTFTPLGLLYKEGSESNLRAVRRIVWSNLIVATAIGLAIIVVALSWAPEIVKVLSGDREEHFVDLFFVMSVAAAVSLLQSYLGFVLTGLNIIRPQSFFVFMRIGIFSALVFFFLEGLDPLTIVWLSLISALPALFLGFVIALRRTKWPREAAKIV